MTLIHRKSPLDNPLKQFLDDAGGYFEHAYDNAGSCQNRCYSQLRNDLKAAAEDEDKVDKAYADNQKCLEFCPSLVPPFQL